METIDLSQTLPDNLSAMLSSGVMIIISTIIVLLIVVFKRWHARLLPLICGIVSYVIFAFMCTNVLTGLVSEIPGVDQIFENNQTIYKVVYYIISVLCFMAARILLTNILVGKYDRKGDALIAGLGLGIGDCILYGFTLFSYMTWNAAIQTQGLESIFSQFSSDEIQSTYELVSGLFTSPAVLWALISVSCVMDMVLNMVFMYIMSGIVRGNLTKWFYLIVAGINLLTTLSFQLYQDSSITSITYSFLLKTLIFVAILYYVIKIANWEISYQDD